MRDLLIFTWFSCTRQRSSSCVSSRLSLWRSSSSRRWSRSSQPASSVSSCTSLSCWSSSASRCRFTSWMSCAWCGSDGGLGVLGDPPNSYSETKKNDRTFFVYTTVEHFTTRRQCCLNSFQKETSFTVCSCLQQTSPVHYQVHTVGENFAL